MKIGIIIQARMGSTRLPGKMLLPFYKSFSIADIIFAKVSSLVNQFPVILATSKSSDNDKLSDLAKQYGLSVFRGSESDVLDRFICAAYENNVDVAIRVCADNPFISVKYLLRLIDIYRLNQVDYLSYCFENELPVIKSHLGLFAEIVRVKALEKVKTLTEDKFFFEHVTNYIYSNPKIFKVSLHLLPDFLLTKQHLRLTVDTSNDFELTKSLFSSYQLKDIKADIELIDLLGKVEGNQGYLEIMALEILKNGK
ncbi:MAG: cytidylyltransferase domain-containing protein [Luteibaculaceae bacterium]